MPKRLADVKEIANFLGVSPKTIYTWAELRQIPHIKLCGALRFDMDEIVQWVETCKRSVDSGIIEAAQAVAVVPRKGR